MLNFPLKYNDSLFKPMFVPTKHGFFCNHKKSLLKMHLCKRLLKSKGIVVISDLFLRIQKNANHFVINNRTVKILIKNDLKMLSSVIVSPKMNKK